MPDVGPIVLLAVDLAVGEALHRLQVGEVALGVPVGGVAILQIGERSAIPLFGGRSRRSDRSPPRPGSLDL